MGLSPISTEGEAIARILPADWSAQGKRVFDFDPAGGEAPPLDAAGGGFDLVRAPRAFTRLGGDWAEWLAELDRLLAGGGLLVTGLLPQGAYEELTGNAWDESRVGMSVLEGPDEDGPLVVHSEWWLREHWGRCFELVSLQPGEDRVWVVLRKGAAACDAAELSRPAEDPRELSALAANVADLHALRARRGADRRRRLEVQKEELNRELVRKTYQISRAEREAERAVKEVTASLSWTVTRPLRGVKTLLAKRREG